MKVNRISSEVWRLTPSVIELFQELFSVIEKRVLWHHVGFRYITQELFHNAKSEEILKSSKSQSTSATLV